MLPILTDSCSNRENSVFTVRFHNLDNYEIDIKEYDNNWNEKIIKARIQPGDDHTLEVNFTQRFFFKRSDYDKRLKATANGVTSNVFQGCRYQAKEGRLLSVDIISGNQSANFQGVKQSKRLYQNFYTLCYLLFNVFQ